jgi:cytosine permease
MANGNLPGYLASAKPNPAANRAPWYKNTAQVYAGIMLWFVFWSSVPGSGAGGTLAQGLGLAFVGLIAAALICYLLFYLAPGMMGMKTGLPLYIVGTSTYGAQGGFIMPGVLMGLLQFGWLAVNGATAGLLLVLPFFDNDADKAGASAPYMVVAAVWIALGAFMGVKGIKYVARVATFLPLVPLAILVILLVATIGGIGNYNPDALVKATQVPKADAPGPLSQFGVVAMLCTIIVGFFATAGAAGADFGMNNRNAKDVHMGGLVGVALSIVFAGGLALLIVAGAYGGGMASSGAGLDPTKFMNKIVGEKTAAVFMYLLALCAFPSACFSSLIAANSFKSTLPSVKPLYSCGLGAIVAIILAVTGWAGKAVDVFVIIGASFGPVCGAMLADYLLSGCKWAGPRAGVNPAGLISWVLGFVVGAADFIPGMAGKVPCPPVAAFVVGFILYLILAKIGLQSRTLEMPAAAAK